MGKKYRYLPHTADMAFVGYGRNLGEAVENAALALLGIMLDVKRVEKDRARVFYVRISEKAETREDLVWFTLQDILSEVDARYLRACRFEVLRLTEGKRLALEGRLVCKDTETDYALLGVKAVTPHELEVKESRGRTSVHAVVDV